MYNMQSEATQVRRDETELSTMRAAERAVRRLQEGLQMAAVRGNKLRGQAAWQSKEGYVGAPYCMYSFP